jgi:hypothetical protein
MKIQRKLGLSIVIAIAIFSLAMTMPELPKERYEFKQATDEYSNYQFSTLIFDTWTGSVSYIAEGRFPGKEGEETRFEPVGRILRFGSDPSEVRTERYCFLAAQAFLVFLGYVCLKKDNKNVANQAAHTTPASAPR